MAIPATNKLLVEAHRVQPIDHSHPQAPSSKVYHGFALQANNVTIGRVTMYTPPERDRTVTIQKELNPLTFGQPVDVVPAGAENFTMNFSRTEVWGAEIEKAFGETDIYMFLTSQNRPLSLDEVIFQGERLYQRFRYLAVWYNNISFDGFDATGDGIVRVTANLTYGNKIRITG